MVGQFQGTALWVEGYRLGMVAGHEPYEALCKVRMVVESGVRLV